MKTPIFPSTKWGNLKAVEEMYKKEKNARLKVRLNAIRLLMMRESQKEVAKSAGVDVATIRSWRCGWDKQGKEGLKDKRTGRKSKVTPEIRLDIEGVIDIKKEIDGRIITGKLIHGYIKKNTE